MRAPLLSATLFVTWLLLANSLEPAQLALGAALALIVPRFTDRLRPERPRVKKPMAIARLIAVVVWDIVLANLEVARRILGPEAALAPRFVWVPLDLRDAHGIVTLAGIIAITPGTVSVDLSDDRRQLLVHALHVDDEAVLIEQIKSRYERPLREILE